MVYDISTGVLAGQTKVDQDVARGTLGPSVCSRFALEVLLSVNLDWVESVGIHPGRIKHNVIRRAVAQEDVRVESTPRKMNG
jgi:hypothetical protein